MIESPQATPCKWCSVDSYKIWHGGKCPKVKAIEYHPNGAVKRVEFYGPCGFVPSCVSPFFSGSNVTAQGTTTSTKGEWQAMSIHQKER